MKREVSTLVSTSILCCVFVVFALSSERNAPVLFLAAALSAAIAISSMVQLLRGRSGRR